MRPFLATASGLSLASFPFWNKQCSQVLKRIVPFLPICTALAPPSCVVQRSALGDRGRSEGELGEWRLVLANELCQVESRGHGPILAVEETEKQGEEVASVLVCVFLYIDTPRLPHSSEPLEP